MTDHRKKKEKECLIVDGMIDDTDETDEYAG